MPSLFSGIMGGDNAPSITNEIIANDMLAGAKAAAQGYLNAAIEASTPELKNLFSSNVTQVLQGQQTISELALRKNWYSPYKPEAEQLKETMQFSENMTRSHA
ncbi:MAG: spore coat protein [Firmicutes bacterium]|nr:spore coat protein [Bacillota bacterium]